MEFFLWFWLLDRRFFCEMRPLLKHFAFLWLIPILLHLLMASFNIYCLYLFKNYSIAKYVIICITVIEIISIICLLVMMINLYNLSKNQPTQNKNIFVLIYEQIKLNVRDDKDNFIYYEDYWMARKNLLSANGIIILLLSVIHIAWSYYYLLHKKTFQDIFIWGEKIVISYAYLNIIFCIPVIFLILYAGVVKFSFVLSSMLCTNWVFSISKKFCKKNKGLNKTIDFSNVQTLEPEFI